jgi:hypothetical protein
LNQKSLVPNWDGLEKHIGERKKGQRVKKPSEIWQEAAGGGSQKSKPNLV